MRQAGDHNALVGLNAIPDPERKLMDGRAPVLARALDDLILEGIVADAGEGAADLFDESVAEAGLARLVVVLGGGDVPFGQGVMRTGRFKKPDDGAVAAPLLRQPGGRPRAAPDTPCRARSPGRFPRGDRRVHPRHAGGDGLGLGGHDDRSYALD